MSTLGRQVRAASRTGSAQWPPPLIALFLAAPRHSLALLVSHGNLITLLLNSIDPSYAFEAWKTLTNPDVLLLEPRTGSYTIERLWG